MRDNKQKIAEEWSELQYDFYIPALMLCQNTSELVTEVDRKLHEAR